MSMVMVLRDSSVNKGREKASHSPSTVGKGSLNIMDHPNFICPSICKHSPVPHFLGFSPYSISVHANKLLLPKVSDPHLPLPQPEASATPSPSSSIICGSLATMKTKVGGEAVGRTFPDLLQPGHTGISHK